MPDEKQFLEKIKTQDIATKTPYGLLTSSAYEFCTEVEEMNRKWLDSHRESRRRLFENIRAYVPVDGSSWPEEAYAALKKEGRHPASFDIASRKIDSLAGSIRSEKWDFDFLPLDMTENPLTTGIRYYYFADKEQGNYSQSENHCLIRGLLHSGIEEMEISYTVRDTGAISFFCPQSGLVLKDPYWQTDDLHDWVRAIKHGYFTAREIISKWGIVNDEISKAAEAEKGAGESYGAMDNVDMYENAPQAWGSRHLCLEYRWIEAKKTTRLHGQRPDGKWVEFPPTIKDRQEVQQYMKLKGIQRFQDLHELPYNQRTLKFGVCCPGLTKTKVLEKADHPVQCGGIGFFPFSACREFGIDKGIMDAMMDVLHTVNYRQAKIDDILASTAAGAKAINLDALPNGESDLPKIQENITRPNYVFGVHGNPAQIMGLVPTNPIPNGLFESLNSMIDMFDRVTPVTPAMEGTGEQSESGVLYEMRHAVSKLGTLILYENWRQHLMNKAEAWYNQALITYKGIHHKVPNTDRGGMIEFNRPIYIDQGGGKISRGYENAISALPRSRVIVSLSKESPTERVGQRAMLYDITKILSAHPDLFKPEIRVLINQIFGTIELPPKDKVRIETLNKMQEMQDMLQIAANIENIKAGGMQAQMMQQQIMMQMQQITAQMQQQMGGGQPQRGQPGQPGQQPQQGGGGQTQVTMEEEVAPPTTDSVEADFLEVPVETQGIQTREEATASS